MSELLTQQDADTVAKAILSSLQLSAKTATTLVAVYGSLKEGFGNHPVLRGSPKVAESATKDAKFSMISLGGYPGVLPDGENKIACEIYSVTHDVLFHNLDRLEGHPTFYCREQLEFDNGMTAWMYVLASNRYKRDKELLPPDENNVVEWKKTDVWGGC